MKGACARFLHLSLSATEWALRVRHTGRFYFPHLCRCAMCGAEVTLCGGAIPFMVAAEICGGRVGGVRFLQASSLSVPYSCLRVNTNSTERAKRALKPRLLCVCVTVCFAGGNIHMSTTGLCPACFAYPICIGHYMSDGNCRMFAHKYCGARTVSRSLC